MLVFVLIKYPAPLQAAALAQAQVPQVDPAHLDPAALVLQALAPHLPAPQDPPAPAADAMTTAADPAQRESLHLMQNGASYALFIEFNVLFLHLLETWWKWYILCLWIIRSKTQKRGDDKERRKRSPSPKPTKVHLGRLTRNVTKVSWKTVRLFTTKCMNIIWDSDTTSET